MNIGSLKKEKYIKKKYETIRISNKRLFKIKIKE